MAVCERLQMQEPDIYVRILNMWEDRIYGLNLSLYLMYLYDLVNPIY